MDTEGDGMEGVEAEEEPVIPAANAEQVKEEGEADEEGPEFHVTLDKVPLGLQNTILVNLENIFLNLISFLTFFKIYFMNLERKGLHERVVQAGAGRARE
jgi:hypothetical protein